MSQSAANIQEISPKSASKSVSLSTSTTDSVLSSKAAVSTSAVPTDSATITTGKRQGRVLIMAAGTGGHVFPGIAIAQALKQEGFDIHWLGTQGGLEAQWVSQAGIAFSAIDIKGLRGNGALGWLLAPVNISRAIWQARAQIQRYQPDIVLGMGGFVCGPGGVAAWLLRKPLLIHEQNAIAGLTNKLLTPIAALIMTGFEQQQLTGPKVVLTGNPVRQGLEQVPQLKDLAKNRFNEETATVNPSPRVKLLVLGGSRGALALNDMVPKAVALLPEALRPEILHQSGQKTFEHTQQNFAEQHIPAKVTPFIDDMVQAYQDADVVICRAGALTVSELMAVARPAILVPYPYAVDDHQTHNAQALVACGGAQLIQEKDLTPQTLASLLQAWIEDPTRRLEASQRIREHAPKRALETICQKIIDYSESWRKR